MKQYDNNIEKFDAYLNGMMSDNERVEFEKLLGDDPSFNKEFKDYKELLYALQASCSDADAEFEEAMKGISDEDMNKIVASTEQKTTLAETQEKPKGKMVPLKTVYRWMSAAAVVLLVVGVGSHLYFGRKTQSVTGNGPGSIDAYNTAVVTNHSFQPYSTRGEDATGKEEYDSAIKMLNENPTGQAIEILEKLYKDPSTDKQLKIRCEKELVFAYMKNHDIDNAKRIINEIKKRGEIKDPELKELDKLITEQKK